MNWIKKLFRKRDTALSKPVVSGSFKEWYLEYRNEMAKAFNADYAICIASWTFSENHEKYFIKGLSPKEAVLEYMAEKNMQKTIDVLVKQLNKVNEENEKLKFRLSNVSVMLIDFCQSVQCYDIQQGTKGIKEGVEDYLESINLR